MAEKNIDAFAARLGDANLGREILRSFIWHVWVAVANRQLTFAQRFRKNTTLQPNCGTILTFYAMALPIRYFSRSSSRFL